MKKTLKLLGIIAMTAVISLSMLSCQQEPEEKGVSLPTAPDIKTIPVFSDGAIAANRDEALELYAAVSGVNSPLIAKLLDEYNAKFDQVFKESYGGKTPEEWAKANTAETKPKLKVQIIKAGLGMNVHGTVSNEITFKDLNLGQYLIYMENRNGPDPTPLYTQNGQSMSSKSSSKVKFTLGGDMTPQEFVQFTANYGTPVKSGNFKVGGVITVESKKSGTTTLKDKTDQVLTSKRSNEINYSIALTVVETTSKKAAKFRFSYATSDSGNTRKVSSDSYDARSNLEIYGDVTSGAPNYTVTPTALGTNVSFNAAEKILEGIGESLGF